VCNNCSSISIRTCGEPIEQLVNQIQSNRCPTAECIDLVWGLQIGQWCSPDHTLHSFQVVMNLQRFQIRYCVNRSILSNNKAMWYNSLLWTAQALKTIQHVLRNNVKNNHTYGLLVFYYSFKNLNNY
jgi:hypothetical protein